MRTLTRKEVIDSITKWFKCDPSLSLSHLCNEISDKTVRVNEKKVPVTYELDRPNSSTEK
jgi:hypothetical protein